MIKIIGLLLTTIIKFIIVPYLMIEMDYNFLTIIVVHSSGAALGVFIFYNFGDIIFRLINSWKRKKKKTTKSKRWIINIKNKYQLKGLLFISGIISVPIASLLAARYFKSNTTMAYLIMAFFIWSLIITGVSYILYYIIH